MTNWLMKSEPDAYGIDDLKRDRREPWDGIRNYQARNMMRDDMQIGDKVFFYHSNCKDVGVVGVMKVASKPYPDPTQFDPESNWVRSCLGTGMNRLFGRCWRISFLRLSASCSSASISLLTLAAVSQSPPTAAAKNGRSFFAQR